jgi:uncharacterized protein YjbI with pentapeptide repeats
MKLVEDSELIKLLRNEDFGEFNRRAQAAPPDLRNAVLRMLDLRRADLRTADLRGAYLRDVDLRGLDLSNTQLDGASLHGAKVSGVLFPRNLSAQEILLSLHEGVRVRVEA